MYNNGKKESSQVKSTIDIEAATGGDGEGEMLKSVQEIERQPPADQQTRESMHGQHTSPSTIRQLRCREAVVVGPRPRPGTHGRPRTFALQNAAQSRHHVILTHLLPTYLLWARWLGEKKKVDGLFL